MLHNQQIDYGYNDIEEYKNGDYSFNKLNCLLYLLNRNMENRNTLGGEHYSFGISCIG